MNQQSEDNPVTTILSSYSITHFFARLFSPSTMAANLPGLSASVTRILYLSGFSKELKMRDIQIAFSKFEKSPTGLKIKWKDDTSLLIVFQDPTVGEYTSG